MTAPARPAVLFVCLGNICRSPMAEGAFRSAAREAGLDVLIESAGTGDWHVGNPPDVRAQATARRYGIDISAMPRGRSSQATSTRSRTSSHWTTATLQTSRASHLQMLAPKSRYCSTSSRGTPASRSAIPIMAARKVSSGPGRM